MNILKLPRIRILLIALLLGLALTALAFFGLRHSQAQSAQPPVDPYPGVYGQGRVNVSSLNLRTGPHVSYTAVAYLMDGEEVRLVGRNRTATWVQIELYNGYRGWVNARYLQTTVNVGALPVADVALLGITAFVTNDPVPVYAGPGALYQRVGTARPGEVLALNGRYAAATWVHVYLPDGRAGWAAADVLIKNCRVRDSARSGIRLFGKNLGRNATIVNCTVTGSGRAARVNARVHGHGIELTFGRGVMIANCTIGQNAGAGIQVRQGAKDTTIQENTLYDNAGPGIVIGNSPRTAVTDNFIYLTGRPRAVKGLRPDGIAIADLPRRGQRYPATRGTAIRGNVVANCETLLRVHNEPERKRHRTRLHGETVMAHNTLVGGPMTRRGVHVEPCPYGAHGPAVFRDNIIHLGHAAADAPIANESGQPIRTFSNAWSKTPPAVWASGSDVDEVDLDGAAVVLSGEHPEEDDFAPAVASRLIGRATDEATIGALEPLPY